MKQFWILDSFFPLCVCVSLLIVVEWFCLCVLVHHLWFSVDLLYIKQLPFWRISSSLKWREGNFQLTESLRLTEGYSNTKIIYIYKFPVEQPEV